MNSDFDKEIDILLRRMPKSDADISANETLRAAHPDADEISAFAENALPEKARRRYAAHFADCGSCRENLSELILLNAENESETPEEKKEITIAAPVIPWYRKLFAFPNIAYAMGALVLAFTGLTAFIVLQNFTSENLNVARTSNTNSIDRASAPMQGDPLMETSNTASNANSATNISPLNSPDTSVQSPLNKSAGETNLPEQTRQESLPLDEADSTSAKPSATPAPTEGAKIQQSDKENLPTTPMSADGVTVAESQTMPPPAPAPKPAARKKIETEDSANVTLSERSSGKDDNENRKSAGSANLSGERQQIGGKTFTRKDRVWYDSAYRNQPTTNVRRGTNDYKKLDSGLRSITDKLAGVVVIVWKEKAYRIQ